MVIADINLQGAELVASDIEKSGGKAIAIQTDVTSVEEVTRMAGAVLERWGAIDILVNNAGGFDKFSSILDITADEWDQVIALNLKGTFLCCQAVARNMMERKQGRIIRNLLMTELTKLT